PPPFPTRRSSDLSPSSGSSTPRTPRLLLTDRTRLITPPHVSVARMAIVTVLALLAGFRVVGDQGQGQRASSGAEAKIEALVAKLRVVNASNPALRQELLKMGEEDQRLRAEGQRLWEAKGPDS